MPPFFVSYFIPFYCDMIPLIFNGSQVMPAVPHDMGRDMIKSFLLVQQLDFSLGISGHTPRDGDTDLTLSYGAHTSHEGAPSDHAWIECHGFTYENPSLVTIEITPDDKEHRRGRSPGDKTALLKAAVVRDFETLMKGEPKPKKEQARSEVANKHHISAHYVRSILKEHRKCVTSIRDRYGKAMR